ncbi:MAG: hypothetical protein KBE65_00535 [Phycisphaerae bacterium]|nr:hypothetical protein [Phycisphaerae bacterium]
MAARVIRNVVLIACMGLILTGCGRQVSQDPSQDPDLLATGPDPGSSPVPRPFIAASIEAAGGLPAWTQCTKIQFGAIVTANYPDGGLYLTEHAFTLYPWSNAIRAEAGEPFARFTWQVVQGRYSFEGDEQVDVSPLRGSYPDYSEAVLQIVTAPIRVLAEGVSLSRRAQSVQLAGQWYQPIDARYEPRQVVSKEKGSKKKQVTLVEPSWTQGTYFQNQDTPFMDMIWLGNPVAGKFVLVRGYDYSRPSDSEVLIPTKIEVFQSGPQAECGPRIALIDLKR